MNINTSLAFNVFYLESLGRQSSSVLPIAQNMLTGSFNL